MFNTMRLFSAILLLSLTACATETLSNKQDIISVKEIAAIEQAFAGATPSTLVLVDIDNTIIEPRANMFRAGSADGKFIDNLKRQRYAIKNWDELLANFRLSRKMLLVHKKWPTIINELKARNVPVYALTQLDHGPAGRIPRTAAWRYKELAHFGIKFTATYTGFEEKELIPATGHISEAGYSESAIFYRGFFMNGYFSKGAVVEKIIAELKPTNIIFVDDRADHVASVAEACAKTKTPYIGIIYRGTELIKGKPNPKIIAYQREQFLKYKEWVDDEEAAKRLAAQ